MDYFPIFLRLANEPVLVVGGGEVAARKIDLLLRTTAKVTVVSPGTDRVVGDEGRGRSHHLRSRASFSRSCWTACGSPSRRPTSNRSTRGSRINASVETFR